MKKKTTPRKLTLYRESLRQLTAADIPVGGATGTSINVGCTSEYTWYCPTASACTNCPICNA